MEHYSEFQLIVYLSGHNFTVLVHSQHSHSVVFRGKAVKSHRTRPAQQQTADRHSREQLVNIVEHLAAKQTDISLRRWWRPKTELKEREYWTHIHQVTQTQLHMNDHVAL